MSVWVLLWAQKLRRTTTGNSFRVLMALAERCDDDGGNCYPSLEFLAESAMLDRSSVARSLKALEADGIITREAGGGRTRSTHYRINLEIQPLPRPTPGRAPHVNGHAAWFDAPENSGTTPPISGTERENSGTTPLFGPENSGTTPQFCGTDRENSGTVPLFIPENSGVMPPFSPGNSGVTPQFGGTLRENSGTMPPDSVYKRESKKESSLRSDSRARAPARVEPDMLGQGEVIPLADHVPDRIAEAVKVWNEVCGPQLGRIVRLTPERRARLGRVLRDDMPQPGAWRGFCETVVSSDFLAGRVKDWRADFDWVLKPQNTLRILEGSRFANRPAPAGAAGKPSRNGAQELAAEWLAADAAAERHTEPLAWRLVGHGN